MRKSKIESLGNVISHGSEKDFNTTYEELKRKIIKDGNLQNSTAAERFELLEELAHFNFGKFLILNRGINGFWTRYFVLHPQEGRLTGKNDEDRNFTRLEEWLLDRSPIILATQERFFNFQRLLQHALKEGVRLASIPCGVMDDLLGLNYLGLNDFTLTGIDLDQESIEFAKQNAKQNHLEKNCEYLTRDAWDLEIKEEYDVITSNGLNIYEPDDSKVQHLYANFFKALKSGGQLISSFLTPSPSSNKSCPWDMKQINQDDLRMQKVIMNEILDVKWHTCYRTEEETKTLLNKAGFKEVRFIYDRQKIFPTFVAQK
jgi:ubiquinone/menaquinone biosynthesis C-methylase UbiE